MSFKTMALLAGVVGFTVSEITAATPNRPVQSPPQLIYRVDVEYPPDMWNAGISGEVQVDFVVDIQGKPTQITAVKSSRKEFEASAIAAVAKWRFKPMTIDGKPVEARLSVPVVFTPGKKGGNKRWSQPG